MIEWKDFNVVEEYPRVKNKKVKAVRVDKENADQIEAETQVFTKFNDSCILTGFMSFQRIPCWLVNINPKSRPKHKKYIFESDGAMERFYNEVES